MSEVTNTPEPKNQSGKWSQSCSGQAVFVGCGTPIFLFILALIFSADEFALLIPIIFIFFTLPLLVIGLISDGKALATQSGSSNKNQVDQVPHTTVPSEEMSEESAEKQDDQDSTSNNF